MFPGQQMLPSETFLTVFFSEESQDTSSQKHKLRETFFFKPGRYNYKWQILLCSHTAIASTVVFLGLVEQTSGRENTD